MRILRLPEVISMTGLQRSSIYAYVKKNAFPQPIRLGERAVGWNDEEVQSWLDKRAEMRGI